MTCGDHGGTAVSTSQPCRRVEYWGRTPKQPPTPPTCRDHEPRAPERPTFDAPGEIDATGRMDVAGELTRWIESVPDGAVIRFAAGGTYRVDDGRVLLVGRRGIRIEFQGATLVRTRLPDPHLRYRNRGRRGGYLMLEACEDTEVVDPRVRGVNHESYRHPARIQDATGAAHDCTLATSGRSDAYYTTALEFEHGVDIDNCRRVTIYGGHIQRVFGDAVFARGDDIHLLPMPGTPLAPGCGLIAESTGRQGTAMTRGTGFRLIGVQYRRCRRSAANFEPLPGHVVRGVEMAYCAVDGCNGLPVSSGGGGAAHDVRIHRCTFTGGGTPVIHCGGSDGVTRRSGWTVEDCTGAVGGSPAAALRFDRVDGVTVRRNRFSFPERRAMTAVALRDCTGVAVTGNDWIGAAHESVRD